MIAGMATVSVERAAGTADVPIDRYTLRAADGAEACVLTHGATLQAVRVPDREGRMANVVLGFASPEAYTTEDYRADNPYFGVIAGRYANRIAEGRFTLDGTEHQLTVNNGPNHLHGGDPGFDGHPWQARAVEGDGEAGVELWRTSPDGEQGYPGEVTVHVTYTWTDDHELRLDYAAEVRAPTILNVTNHAYYNLGGEGSGTAEDHLLRIAASRYTPVDETHVPTGELAPVEGTPMDFRSSRPIGERVREAHPQLMVAQGYDHNFALDAYREGTTEPHEAAVLTDPASGRELRVHTTEPGLQFYSGNFLDGTVVGGSGRTYRQGDGVCLETQHFPNSPNLPHFPSTVVRPGTAFRSRTVLRFGIAA